MTYADAYMPESLDEIAALLLAADGAASPMVTGTRVLAHASGPAGPTYIIVDMGRVPELNRVEFDERNGLLIGAAVSLAEPLRFPPVQHAYAMLVDGGYVMHEDIDSAESGGTTVYAPVRERKGKAGEKNRYERTPRDTDGVAKWRERMGTPTAAEIYKQRAATAECVNALARNRGLRRVWVRGLAKVKAGLLWYALAHNLMRAASLRRGCSATA